MSYWLKRNPFYGLKGLLPFCLIILIETILVFAPICRSFYNILTNGSNNEWLMMLFSEQGRGLLWGQCRSQSLQGLHDVLSHGTDADVEFLCHFPIFPTLEITELENLLGLWGERLYPLVHRLYAPLALFPRTFYLLGGSAIDYTVEVDVLLLCRFLSDEVDALVVDDAIKEGGTLGGFDFRSSAPELQE